MAWQRQYSVLNIIIKALQAGSLESFYDYYMRAPILIFDSNLTKIKYGNRVVETYLSLGIKQFTSKNCEPIL